MDTIEFSVNAYNHVFLGESLFKCPRLPFPDRSCPQQVEAMTTRNTCCLLLVVIATAAIICAFAPSPAAADPYLCPWRTVAHPVTRTPSSRGSAAGRWSSSIR